MDEISHTKGILRKLLIVLWRSTDILIISPLPICLSVNNLKPFRRTAENPKNELAVLWAYFALL